MTRAPQHQRLLSALGILAAITVAALLAPSAAFPAPPGATFTFSPNPPLSGETVSFDASGSAPAGGETITGYNWDLDGDGEFDDASESNVSFTYPTSGPRTVRLRVDASSGDSASTDRIVRVGNRPPTASFQFAPESPLVGQTVRLASTSFDPDGPIVSHDWDLDGDGEFDDATGRAPEKTFAEAGSFTFGLRVMDSDGASHEVTAPVIVEDSDLVLLSPFPIVRLAGLLRRSGNTAITRLSVRAPKGTDVAVRCRGKSCPFKSKEKSVLKRRVRFPEIVSVLEPGALIEVFITDRDRIGKLTRFKIRDGRAPKRSDKCLRGEQRQPIPCPPS